jgi:antitoxin (DNA-binding transcriptional repressor) of toxin-antitoxin stability system
MDDFEFADVPLKEAKGRVGNLARAAESGEITRLTDRGRPIAAIVPLEVMTAGVLALRSQDETTTLEEEQRLLGARVMKIFEEHDNEMRRESLLRARRRREYRGK